MEGIGAKRDARSRIQRRATIGVIRRGTMITFPDIRLQNSQTPKMINRMKAPSLMMERYEPPM
jgi:hypothetical protein